MSDLSCSPNGKVLAFVKSEASVKENCYKSAIWLMEDGKCRRLTTGGNRTNGNRGNGGNRGGFAGFGGLQQQSGTTGNLRR